MTKIVEEQHLGESTLLWKLGNATAVDSDIVMSVGVAWLFKENGVWKFIPRITGETSLFYNAVFFFRYTTTLLMSLVQLAILTSVFGFGVNPHVLWALLLTGIFWSVRWGSSVDKKSLFQTGCGYKLNGRFGILFRIQSDKTSAEGVTGPNTGQAQGFEYGTH